MSISPQRYGRCESSNACTDDGDVQNVGGITSHGERYAEILERISRLLCGSRFRAPRALTTASLLVRSVASRAYTSKYNLPSRNPRPNIVCLANVELPASASLLNSWALTSHSNLRFMFGLATGLTLTFNMTLRISDQLEAM